MAPLAGFDVRRDPIGDVFPEVSPGVAGISLFGDAFALNAPDGYPDGIVQVLTVPGGVHAITYQVVGCMGGFSGVPWAGDPSSIPIEYARRVPVEPGQEITFCVAGPPLDSNSMVATRGNGPLRGGNGTTDSFALFGGAGGGASALYLDDTMLALSPGGGGYFGNIDTDVWNGPGPVYPGGSPGSESQGGSGPVPSGGGGGGTPGGDGGALNTWGANGAGVSSDHDPGGPPSPTWAETLLGSGDNRVSDAVARVYFYLPPVNRWHVGLGW